MRMRTIIIFDVGKTMSDVEKTTSDIGKIISDLFSPPATLWETTWFYTLSHSKADKANSRQKYFAQTFGTGFAIYHIEFINTFARKESLQT